MDFTKFKAMVAEGLGIDAALLTKETSFRDDLGIDSLSIINFLVKVERQFEMKFDAQSIATLNNLGEIYDRFRLALVEETPCSSNQ